MERRVKKHLEAKGWYVVRAAGSKGLTDLVAVTPDGKRAYPFSSAYHGRIVFLQCKRNGKIAPRELHDFQQLVGRIHGAEGYIVRGGRVLEAREVLFWERNEWEPIGESL